ncbi:16S rRNA (cytidine(1402)-2'-O)-methyltransferase [bacterium]|nr:16S rRNA (cytidine(1402)-2'-O)-methyltransferase [bacterium]
MKPFGTLYIVATPIGNLEDITFRAVKTLKEVNLIACEDTRTSGILLKHFGIETQKTSYHDFSEASKLEKLLSVLKEGKSVAVISDAGTPGISDPAFRLVRSAIENKIQIVPIPGACAGISALVVSGATTDRFAFEGFLPTKKGRETKLKELSGCEQTLIFYESPHRILKTLEDFKKYFPGRKVIVGREITKVFEEFLRGTFEEVIEEFKKKPSIKGEFVIVIDKK